MSTFSLFRKKGPASLEAGSAAESGWSLKPKRVRSGRSGAESSGFSTEAGAGASELRFLFFAMEGGALGLLPGKALRRRRRRRGSGLLVGLGARGLNNR